MNQYRTEHLLLLIGNNPLPNAVAGILLTAPENAISLLHSAGTFDVALRLRKWLEERGRKVRPLRQIDESDPASIFSQIQAELRDVVVSQIGLNYTGGTKAMSVHAYRAIERWAQQKRSHGQKVVTTFSYLNPRKLEMIIDPTDPQSGENSRRIAAGLEPELTLTDLLDLHGWSLKHSPKSDPVLPDSARALAIACAEEESFDEWSNWVLDELRSDKCRTDGLKSWKKGKDLPAFLNLPNTIHLLKVVAAFRSELTLASTNLDLDQPKLASPKDKEKERKSARRFCEWLGGKWLEDHVLDELNHLSKSLGIHQAAQNVVTNEIEFDVDVVALRGYQLFAFSCSTDEEKGLLKLKLFEAYVRARQLGGDEARVALVCCYGKPEQIEQEMRHDIDLEERIRVFGKRHLSDISTHLAYWIREQSKGV
jgi:hypothetical protein